MSADRDPGASPAAAVQVTASPPPTDEEAVAIVAALQVALGGGTAEASPEAASRWRFSGRWWSKPVAARRSRPS